MKIRGINWKNLQKRKKKWREVLTFLWNCREQEVEGDSPDRGPGAQRCALESSPVSERPRKAGSEWEWTSVCVPACCVHRSMAGMDECPWNACHVLGPLWTGDRFYPQLLMGPRKNTRFVSELLRGHQCLHARPATSRPQGWPHQAKSHGRSGPLTPGPARPGQGFITDPDNVVGNHPSYFLACQLLLSALIQLHSIGTCYRRMSLCRPHIHFKATANIGTHHTMLWNWICPSLPTGLRILPSEYLPFYLKDRQNERHRERDICHALISSPNVCDSRDWAQINLGAMNLI